MNISLKDVSKAFVFDKKNIGESLEWILLEQIGKPKIVKNRDIPPEAIQQTLKEILRK
jgi:3-dehydroquinate synthetase